MVDTPRSEGRIDAAERRAQVIALRRQRYTFDDIGRALGISRQRAHQLYLDVLRSIPAPDLEAHRAEELELIDDACRGLLKITADAGADVRDRVAAWDVLCKWADRKARLLGLDAPPRIRIEVLDEEVLQAIAERMDREAGQLGLEAAAQVALPAVGHGSLSGLESAAWKSAD